MPQKRTSPSDNIRVATLAQAAKLGTRSQHNPSSACGKLTGDLVTNAAISTSDNNNGCARHTVFLTNRRNEALLAYFRWAKRCNWRARAPAD
jgi:hypothetical protein